MKGHLALVLLLHVSLQIYTVFASSYRFKQQFKTYELVTEKDESVDTNDVVIKKRDTRNDEQPFENSRNDQSLSAQNVGEDEYAVSKRSTSHKRLPQKNSANDESVSSEKVGKDSSVVPNRGDPRLKGQTQWNAANDKLVSTGNVDQDSTVLNNRVTHHDEQAKVRSRNNRFASTKPASDAHALSDSGPRNAEHNGLKMKKRRYNAKQMKGKKFRRKHRRSKSSSQQRYELKQKSCPTRNSFVSKSTAEDIFGDMVDLYPVIEIGNLALDQYFYESFCEVENCSCAGVDKRKHKSSCQTTHRYTYARVVKNGEIGWSFIKVRSGCSCVIQAKRRTSHSSVAALMPKYTEH